MARDLLWCSCRRISSTPSSARITVDNQPLGATPAVVKLSRKDHHIVKIDLAGYQPFEATVTRKVSGWVWGNIVFGGLIGLAVDAMTGGLYNLTPEQVAGQLAKSSASATVTKDGLYVVLVPAPEAEWRRIGALVMETTRSRSSWR